METMGLWGADEEMNRVRMGEVTRDDQGVITARATKAEYMDTVNMVMTHAMRDGGGRRPVERAGHQDEVR